MHLSDIRVHPIKSCRGISLTTATLDERGLVHDRRYMVVDDSGAFVTLRSLHDLVRVEVSIEDEWYGVRFPDGTSTRIPFELDDGDRREVVVWGDRVEALEHVDGSAAFSRAFGRPLHLVHMPRDVVRPVDPKRSRPGDRVSFADAYPLLLISEESITDLSSRVGQELVIARFRPNLVLRGAVPYIEDRLAGVRIGSVTFRGPKTCSRCVATTIDPESGRSGVEPLRTLARFRKRGGEVHLGMNLIHDATGVLHVGDRVEPTELVDAPRFD